MLVYIPHTLHTHIHTYTHTLILKPMSIPSQKHCDVSRGNGITNPTTTFVMRTEDKYKVGESICISYGELSFQQKLLSFGWLDRRSLTSKVDESYFCITPLTVPGTHIYGDGFFTRIWELHTNHINTYKNHTNHTCIHTYTHTHIHTHTYIHIYIYTHIHTCIHTYIHTHIHTYKHTRIHTYTHTHSHTLIHTYTHTYIHVYTHTHISTYTHTHIHTCTHTHIHTYTHTLTYTHIHTNTHIPTYI